MFVCWKAKGVNLEVGNFRRIDEVWVGTEVPGRYWELYLHLGFSFRPFGYFLACLGFFYCQIFIFLLLD